MNKALESFYATLLTVPALMGGFLELGLDKHAVVGIGIATALLTTFIGKYLGKPNVTA